MPPPKQKLWQAREDSRRLNQHLPQSNLLKKDILFPSPPLEPSRPQDPLPLPFNFFFSHDITFEIKHAPTRSIWTQTLIPWKVLRPLVVAQDLVNSVGSDWHILPANAAVKWLGFPDASFGPVTESGPIHPPPHLLHLIRPLRTDSSPGLPTFRLIAAGVSCFKVVRYKRGELCSMLFTGPKTTSSSVNNQANDEYTPKNIRARYGNTTYCSLTAPEFVPFLRRRSTYTASRVDALFQ